MANEVMDGNLEISEDVGSRMVQDALAQLHPKITDQSKPEVPKEEIKTEGVKETAPTEVKPKPETAEGKAPEKTPEITKPEVATAETKKVPYTEEEIADILVNERNIDTSRINPENLAVYKTMQRGLTQKSQRLSDERRQLLDDIAKREKALRDKEIAEEEKKLRAEEELLDPEHAKDRQDKRQVMREKDDMARKIEQIEAKLQMEERQKIADQNFREWNSARIANNLPDDPEVGPVLEDLAYAYAWATTVGAQQQGKPGITISDGAKVVSNLIGNEKNLRKFINANPKFKEALEKEIIENYNKKQADGPNTIRSTSGAIKEKPESDGKPTKEMLADPNIDYQKIMQDEALKMLQRNKN